MLLCRLTFSCTADQSHAATKVQGNRLSNAIIHSEAGRAVAAQFACAEESPGSAEQDAG